MLKSFTITTRKSATLEGHTKKLLVDFFAIGIVKTNIKFLPYEIFFVSWASYKLGVIDGL